MVTASDELFCARAGRAKVLELMPLERARETADAVLQQQMRMLQALSDDVDTIDVMAAMLSTE